MGVTFTLLALVAVLVGLLILAGGAVLMFATEQKKAGIVLLVAGLVIIGCAVLAYGMVILRSMGSM